MLRESQETQQGPDHKGPPVGELTGQVLDGRYELLETIGRGGTAVVYRSRDRRLSRIVAVKVLRPNYASDNDAVQRFQREAEFAAGLSVHPNIVSVYDVGRDGELYFLVMELVPGSTLKEMIERHAPLPLHQSLHIAAEVAAALDFAHRHGFVHRDIKPQNILIAEDGAVKVSDFGIARSVDTTQFTRAGTVFGTAHYISPEQARGRDAQAGSDVYSLGVVLFEMLTGRTPFEADTAIALALQHVQERPPRPSSIISTIPQHLDEVVLKALEKNPRDRFASAARFREALTEHQFHPVVAETQTRVSKSGWKSGWLPAVLLLLLAASLGGAWATYRGVSSLFGTSQAQPTSSKKGNSSHHHKKSPSSGGHHSKGHHSNPVPTLSSAQAAALAGKAQLTYITVGTTSLGAGQSTTFTYTINNTAGIPIPMVLTAALHGDSDGAMLIDSAGDTAVTALPGQHQYSRQFTAPASAKTETYDLIVHTESPDKSHTYGTIQLPHEMTVQGSCCAAGNAGAVMPNASPPPGGNLVLNGSPLVQGDTVLGPVKVHKVHSVKGPKLFPNQSFRTAPGSRRAAHVRVKPRVAPKAHPGSAVHGRGGTPATPPGHLR